MKCYVEAAPLQHRVAPNCDTLALLHAGATVAMTLGRVLDFSSRLRLRTAFDR